MNDNQPANLDKQIDKILTNYQGQARNTNPSAAMQLHDEALSGILVAIQQLLVAERIDELRHVWYDDKLGLVLAHGTGVNDRIAALQSQLTDGGS